jgi:hypothetical protein
MEMRQMDKTMEDAIFADNVTQASQIIAKNLNTDFVSLNNGITYNKFLEALLIVHHVALSREVRYGKSERLASIRDALSREVLDQAESIKDYDFATLL